MKLTDRIHLVGSGSLGFDLTDPFDCHVYLLDGGDELALVDVGAGMGAEAIVANVRAAGFYPADYRFRACPTAGDLVEGMQFRVGRLTVTPFATPGHCHGHLSFLVEGGDRRYLLGGDLVFYGGTIIAQNIHDCSIQEYAASAIKMAGVAFDALLPGHFAISLRDGKRHVDAAARAFEQLMIPRNAL